MILYLFVTLGDTEPEIWGPYATEEERLAAAVAHRKQDPEKRDGLFRLTLIDGVPTTQPFRGYELEGLTWEDVNRCS